MPAQDTYARNAIRVWMRDVLEEKNWSAAEWARAAETSPSNITRVLGPTSDIVPTALTISKLARVAGSQPNLGAFQRVVARHIPLYKFGAPMGSAFARAIAPTSASDDCFAVEVGVDMMNLAGILPGDTIICEPPEIVGPKNGRIIYAKTDDDEFVLGRVMDPWLAFNSTGYHDPQLLGALEVVGVVVSVMRSIR